MFRPFQSIGVSVRCFSTTSATSKAYRLVTTRRVAKRPDYKVGDTRPRYIPPSRAKFPDYKYGESNFYKQSNKGLYGGLFKSSGHSITEFKNKVKRVFKPNIHRKRLWSETLDREVRVKVAARVLRTIGKEGGIDNYLIKDKSARIKELGPLGWRLRYLVMKQKYRTENPTHENGTPYKIGKGKSAKEVRVYFPNVKVEGHPEPLNLTVGKRKLLRLLFLKEKEEKKILGEEINVRDLTNKYFNHSIEQLANALASYGYDMKSLHFNIPESKSSKSALK